MMSLRPILAGVANNPIVARESRTRSRSRVTPLALTLTLAAVAAVAVVVFGLAASRAPDHRPNAAQLARAAYHAMSFQLGFVILLGAALASGSMSRERERGTIDLLLVSDLTSGQIVLAKAQAAVAYLMQFVIAALPLYLAFFLHAGLNLADLLVAEVITVAAAVAGVSLGLFLSALCPRTSTATMAAVGISLALCLDVVLAGVVPVPGTGLAQTRRQLLGEASGIEVPFDDEASRAAAGGTPQQPIHPLRLANPLYALHALVAGPEGRQGSVSLGQLGRSLVPGGKSRSEWGLRVKPWHLSVLAAALFSVVMLAGAANFVRRSPADVRAARSRRSWASG